MRDRGHLRIGFVASFGCFCSGTQLIRTLKTSLKCVMWPVVLGSQEPLAISTHSLGRKRDRFQFVE